MTPEQLQKLIDKRAQTWEAQKAILDDAGTGEGRSFTAEERTAMDKQDVDIDALTADINRGQLALKREAQFALIDEGQRIAPSKTMSLDEVAAKEKRYVEAFTRMLRYGVGGESRLTPEDRQLLAEKRAQGEGTNSAGGYLVPQGYWLKITETLKAFGGLLAIANVIRTTSGQPLPWPSNNDTGNAGTLLAENVQISEVDLTIGQSGILSAWTYTSGLILASLELLQDSAFDLDTWLPTKIGQRLGRGVAADLVTGSGTAKPTGIVLAPTAGVTGATGQATGIIYDNLVDLIHSIDPAYRQMGNCRFLMNDLTVAIIRKLKDSEGRPLWSPSMVQGLEGPEPDTLLGYPIAIDNAMPVMAANAKSILFGDYHAGYVVRQVLDPTIMQLRERYADYLQVGYFGFQRIDGRPDDTAAVKAFVNSAT